MVFRNFMLLNYSGSISLETEQLLYRLKRNLPPGEEPTHLFALNFDVDIWHAKKLCEMEGISMSLRSSKPNLIEK